MNQIRAFVGHSFTDDDKDVVRIFTDHFNTLQRSPLPFSWINAQRAEPVELTAKVLKLIADKNVFIGICTKKQRSVSPDDLVATIWPRGSLRAQQDRFIWKTSDWIMQENRPRDRTRHVIDPFDRSRIRTARRASGER